MSSRSAKELLAAIDDEELPDCRFDWSMWRRPQQETPPGDWTTWLLMGGRGSGKTLAGAQWVRALAADGIGPIGIVGQSMIEAEQVMVRGPSGILRHTPPEELPVLRGNMLYWPNGVEGILLGAADPERFRGPQFAAAWCDEIGKWPHAEAAWDMLQFGLRLGDRPRQLATTTPRPTALIKRLIAEPGTVTHRMRTADNNYLADAFFKAVVARYEHSVLGRQELEGELIEDLPDALWRRGMFRRGDGIGRERTVVAVDPPVTGHRRSDRCGIVVAARRGDEAVVLADLSFGPAHPDAWARRAVAAFHEFSADCIVAETNQGGDMVRAVIAQVDREVPVREVRARQGKWVRAEPVAALYAGGRVAHAAGLTALEDEMCAFGADGLSEGHSPDRVDALVWALTELLLKRGEPRVRSV
jgi:phage terminase large subunit-like protein